MNDTANELSAAPSAEAAALPGGESLFRAFGKPLTLKNMLPAMLLFGAGLCFDLTADRSTVAAEQWLDRMPLGNWIGVSYHLPNIFVIFTILLIVWLRLPAKRPLISLMLLAFAVATPVGGLIKHVTGRARPEWSVAMTDANRKWIEDWQKSHPKTAVTTDKRDQWLWFTSERPAKFEGYPYLISGYTAYPSGHARSAFIMAGFLSEFCPEARVMWYFFATGCATARVEQKAHHPGDALAGAALGYLIYRLLFASRRAFALAAAAAGWLERLLRSKRSP